MKRRIGAKRLLFVVAHLLLLVSLGSRAALADIDNTATANGTYISAGDVPSNVSSVAVPVVQPTGTLAVTKTPDQSVNVSAGTTVTYTYTVRNASNVDLTNISLADTHNGTGPQLVPVFQSFTTNTGSTNSGNTITTLRPNDVAVYTASYIVKQVDVDNKPAPQLLSNTVTATYTRATVAFTAQAAADVDLADHSNAITLDKTAVFNDGGDGKADPGDTISYSFKIENTGNTTLRNVLVTETFGGAGAAPAILIPASVTTDSGSAAAGTLNDSSDAITGDGNWDVLGPGDVVTFTGTYTLVQADIDAGAVNNNATASGTTPTNGSVSAADQTQTDLTGVVSYTFTKTGTLNQGTNGQADAGDVISYQLVVTNTGTVTLKNVKITDPLLASLPQQQFFAKIDALKGGVDPISTATTDLFSNGQRPAANLPMLPKPPVQASLHAERRLIAISGDPAAPAAGDVVGIVFNLVNTGDVPLVNLRAEQNNADAFSTTVDYLAPVAQDKFGVLFTHELTAAEIEAGRIAAPARVTAMARDQTVIVDDDRSLQLSAIVAADEIATASILPVSVASLPPGQSATFTGTYVVTVASMDAGQILNTATVEVTKPDNTVDTKQASAAVPLAQLPSVAMLKSGAIDLGPDGIATPGDTVTYTFNVKNTGNVTLNNLTVTDPLGTVSGTIASLAPGASSTALTLVHALTQADIDAGQIQNQATVNGTGPGPGSIPVSDLSDPTDFAGNAKTITPLATTPKIAIVKLVGALQDVNLNSMTDVGDTAKFTFEVTNAGNVSLSTVSVTDPLPNLPAPAYVSGNFGPATLDPGEKWIFTSTYPIAQTDIDAGQILNQATVSATPLAGPAVTDLSDESSTTGNDKTITPIAPIGRVALIKTVSSIDDNNSNSVTDPGDVIHYAFEIRNLGNVTLTNFQVTDVKVGPVSGTLAALPPGAINATAFSANYTITAADLTAGTVTNSATVVAKTPKNVTVTDTSDNSSPDQDDPTITPVTKNPAVAVLKYVTAITDLNNNVIVDVGDSITYAFSVKNTGNVPLSQVTVTDPLVAVSGGPIGTLLAGDVDTTTFAANYIITLADVTRGYVENKATVTAVDSSNASVSDDSDPSSYTDNNPTRTNLASSPRIALVKQSSSLVDTNTNGKQDVGDTVTYTFAISNLGNTVLTNVTVTDPNAIITGGPIASLGISQTDTVTFTGVHVLTAADFAANGVTNQATASGQPPVGARVSDLSDDTSVDENDATFTSLTGVPSIALVKKRGKIKDSNGNGVTDPGDVITYLFSVTNTGNVPLQNVTVTDANAVVSGGPLATLNAGATNSTTFTASHLVTLADADAGKVVNQATVTATSANGVLVSDASDFAAIAGNSPTVVVITKTAVSLSKVASRTEIRRGERVTYTITASNLRGGPFTIVDTLPPGFTYVSNSARVNGVKATPAANGRTVSFSGLQPDTAGKAVIRLDMIAPATLTTGEYINRAVIFDESSGNNVGTASATVRIKNEHIFDCGEVIGRVFDDLNGNGYADDGEPGLPGVRVATVNGLLLTSDSSGRFHVACADVPDASIGSTYILKLDTRTLPEGYFLTTENPRDIRLTRGKVSKLNFGAHRSCDVALDVKRDAYVGSSDQLRPQWAQGINKLVGVLKQCQGQLRVTYRCGSYAPIAEQRLTNTVAAIRAKWDVAGAPYNLLIQSSVKCGQ